MQGVPKKLLSSPSYRQDNQAQKERLAREASWTICLLPKMKACTPAEKQPSLGRCVTSLGLDSLPDKEGSSLPSSFLGLEGNK